MQALGSAICVAFPPDEGMSAILFFGGPEVGVDLPEAGAPPALDVDEAKELKSGIVLSP
jgi:hypothetical protein